MIALAKAAKRYATIKLESAQASAHAIKAMASLVDTSPMGQNGLSGAHTRHLARPRALAIWLESVAAFVVLIVLVGGITRLTESGLSITEWEVATGILPPLGDAAWQAEFAKYRATPEYRLEASLGGMTLAEFKFIYFWEWFHRLLARMVGMIYALPLIWFWVRGAIPKGYKLRLVGLLALGGLQGLFGWLMVQSGLVGDMTDVSHFRLSLHLLTALLLLACLVWTARDMRRLASDPNSAPARITWQSGLIALALFIQLLLGAWVAGLNAGHAAYDWPLMNDRLVPEMSGGQGLLWAITHDPFILHFLHRWWAWIAVAALIWQSRRVRSHDRFAAVSIHAAVGVMVALGIATVLSQVELWIAAAHQLNGAILVAVTAWAMNSDGAALLARGTCKAAQAS